jgi:surfeit locus 1 family protein
MAARKGQGARLPAGLLAFSIFAGVCAVIFGGLGVWQIERLSWKNGLIEAVETRSTAAPTDLNTADWKTIDPVESEYLRVKATGRFEGPDTFTQAVTVHGGGFWVLTPLHLPDARVLLVNRGFVTAAQRASDIPRPANDVTVTGLLRSNEPDGGFLRANDPEAGRWYSRDITAIGASQNLTNLAPFFLDADAGSEAYPIGGLTVLSFSNNHLIYAITWFGLMMLSLGGLGLVLRDLFR